MSSIYQHLPHAGIRELQPYVPGKSIEELAREQGITDIIKLASNENPWGCSPSVLHALASLSGTLLATYPAPLIHPLHKKLAEKLQIDEEMLTFSNGSDLLFTLLLTVFALHSGRHVLTHEYAFISFAIQTQTLGLPLKIVPACNWQVDIDALIRTCDHNTAIIFIANPNNPTGTLLPLEEIDRLLCNIPKSTIVILDEAYYEYAFSIGDNRSLILQQQHPNLVITRTFSKAYGLAGLRLGYAIAHPQISQLLQKALLPFTVNQAALTAAFAALDDEDFLTHTLKSNQDGLIQLRKGLNDLQLFSLPSYCNFITFDCGKNAASVYQNLLGEGIIVRPLTPYRMPNFLRVSIGKSEQISRFLDKLPVCLTRS